MSICLSVRMSVCLKRLGGKRDFLGSCELWPKEGWNFLPTCLSIWGIIKYRSSIAVVLLLSSFLVAFLFTTLKSINLIFKRFRDLGFCILSLFLFFVMITDIVIYDSLWPFVYFRYYNRFCASLPMNVDILVFIQNNELIMSFVGRSLLLKSDQVINL